MPQIKYFERPEGYRFPQDWVHLRGSGCTMDKSVVVKDEFYGSSTYRSRATWEQSGDEGIFSITVVVNQGDRTEREVEEDTVQSARKIWEVGKHIVVAETQGSNGQCDLYFGFRTSEIPTAQQVEQLYRAVRGFTT